MSAVTVQNEVNWAVMEKVVVGGDLSKLSSQERVQYYRQLCESLRLNPLTRPFQYILLQGKLTLYATKDATEQIRRMHSISIERVEKEVINETYCVTVYGRTPDGRTDTEMGAVSIAGKRGDDLVNAMLKALTKAKRRLTLSMCGLGVLDETEIETIRGARTITPEEMGAEVDQDGQVVAPPPAPIRAIAQPEPDDAQPQMESQRKRMWATAREKGWTPEQIHQLLTVEFPEAINPETKKASTTALNRGDMARLIEMVSTPPPFAEEPVEDEVVGEQAALISE